MSVVKDSISKIIKVNRDSSSLYPGISLAVGFFDGVHLGHQALIKEAKNSNYPFCVLTFADEFKSGLSGKDPELLTSFKEKTNILFNRGAKRIFVLPFKDKIVHADVETFLDFLSHRQVRKLVVGKDFSFGDKGKGTPADLLRMEDRGVEVKILDLREYEFEGKKSKISSTSIRRLLKDKQLEEANKLLGYPYLRSGRVIRGLRNGHKIGFPTANINPPKDKVCLPDGVYQTRTLVEGKWYSSMTNIGTHPTIDERKETVIETNIFGLDFDIYGLTITVSFVRYRRDQVKFDSLKDLKDNLSSLREEILSGNETEIKKA